MTSAVAVRLLEREAPTSTSGGSMSLGVSYIATEYFSSVGKTRPALLLGILRQFLLLIPLTIILPNFFGVIGVFIAFPVSDIIATIISAICLLKETKSLRNNNSQVNAKIS